jgi:hypothetical protein
MEEEDVDMSDLEEESAALSRFRALSPNMRVIAEAFDFRFSDPAVDSWQKLHESELFKVFSQDMFRKYIYGMLANTHNGYFLVKSTEICVFSYKL